LGHAGVQTVTASTGGSRVRFQLPGRPQQVVFEGTLSRTAIAGTVRQGSAHGHFRVRRGEGRSLLAPGFYSSGTRALAVVDDPYGPERLVDLETGEVHGLYPARNVFAIGGGFATRPPVRGTARFATPYPGL